MRQSDPSGKYFDDLVVDRAAMVGAAKADTLFLEGQISAHYVTAAEGKVTAEQDAKHMLALAAMGNVDHGSLGVLSNAVFHKAVVTKKMQGIFEMNAKTDWIVQNVLVFSNRALGWDEKKAKWAANKKKGRVVFDIVEEEARSLAKKLAALDEKKLEEEFKRVTKDYTVGDLANLTPGRVGVLLLGGPVERGHMLSNLASKKGSGIMFDWAPKRTMTQVEFREWSRRVEAKSERAGEDGVAKRRFMPSDQVQELDRFIDQCPTLASVRCAYGLVLMFCKKIRADGYSPVDIAAALRAGRERRTRN